MQQVLAAKQAQYDKEVSSCQQQTIEMYDAAGIYPSSLMDGSHVAVASADGLCVSRKVLVKDNKIVNMVHEDGSTMPFTMSTPIQNAKCIATRIDAETGNTIYYKMYFMEDIFKK